MAELDIRRLYSVSDEILREGDRAVGRPVKRVGVAAVIANPLAGQYGADLDDLIAYGEELGGILTRRAVELLGGEAGESFGKAAIVGLRGELEHAAALRIGLAGQERLRTGGNVGERVVDLVAGAISQLF